MTKTGWCTFKGEKFFLLDGGAMAYPDHIDEDGGLNLIHAFTSDSFAHIYSDGIIKRWGKEIGKHSDLVFLDGRGASHEV